MRPNAEALLLGGYALFLLAVAAGIDLIARHSHRRSERFRTAGFRYHSHLDAWECPEGQQLWPHERDDELRLVRYRGKAHICNACPAKSRCTDSDEGREVVRFLDDWPRLEVGRFHRGLSLTLVILALLLGVVALIRHHSAVETAFLACVLALAAGAVWRFARPFGRPLFNIFTPEPRPPNKLSAS